MTRKATTQAPREPSDIVQEKLDRARLKRKALALFLAAVIVSLCVFAIAGERGAISLYRKWQDRSELQQEIDALEALNASKREQNDRLTNDPEAVEPIAREQLDMMRPGEIMFVLPESSQRESEPTPAASD